MEKKEQEYQGARARFANAQKEMERIWLGKRDPAIPMRSVGSVKYAAYAVVASAEMMEYQFGDLSKAAEAYLQATINNNAQADKIAKSNNRIAFWMAVFTFAVGAATVASAIASGYMAHYMRKPVPSVTQAAPVVNVYIDGKKVKSESVSAASPATKPLPPRPSSSDGAKP